MGLAKFVACAGVCARRKAVEKVRQGLVSINGYICSNPAHHISDSDRIECDGVLLKIPEKKYYILLNKPVGYLTAASNDFGKRTVMELVKDICDQRSYPVGRLDYMTKGRLLFTNDGELTHRLTHPSFEVPKAYKVTIDADVVSAHVDMIKKGITLDDGAIAADKIFYPDPKNGRVLVIQIHSGRNRIVRRIFEHLGYQVTQLERVEYAGLTLDALQEGEHRFLLDEEIEMIKSYY